jgi:hypothetical protein
LFDPLRHEYPNLPAYLIFDAQYLKNGIMHLTKSR